MIPDNAVQIKNDDMNIIGFRMNGVDYFRGIPYAEAPVGALRFAPPIEKVRWTETLDCTEWGNIAIQQGITKDGSAPMHGENESEDCLNLNIWAPADTKAGSNLPVYVWIHGGAFISGSGQEPMYDGTVFAKEGVIVVTINYRLGALGFMSLDSLKKDNSLGTTGNWGTLDQIMALKWIQKNIGKFGGDRNNITLGGESAGAVTVFGIIMSPLAAGLFQKAILESCAVNRAIDASRGHDSSVTVSERIAGKLGADDSAEGIRTLRSLDAFKIMDSTSFSTFLTDDHQCSVWPIGDDAVFPEDFVRAIEKGQYNSNIKILMGNNGAEGTMFAKKDVTDAEFNRMIDSAFSPANASAVKDYYAQKTEMTIWEKTSDLAGMLLVKLGTERIQKLFCANPDTVVYAYQYLHQMNNGTAPFHGIEMNFAFGQDTFYGVPLENDDKTIKDVMHGYWLNFIKNGNPNSKSLAIWTEYSPTADSLMTFNKNNSEMSSRADAATISVLNPLYLP